MNELSVPLIEIDNTDEPILGLTVFWMLLSPDDNRHIELIFPNLKYANLWLRTVSSLAEGTDFYMDTSEFHYQGDWKSWMKKVTSFEFDDDATLFLSGPERDIHFYFLRKDDKEFFINSKSVNISD